MLLLKLKHVPQRQWEKNLHEFRARRLWQNTAEDQYISTDVHGENWKIQPRTKKSNGSLRVRAKAWVKQSTK